MKNYKPKAQDIVMCHLGLVPCIYRLIKPMTEKDCESFGVRWTVNGHLEGEPWLAIDALSQAKVSLLFGKILLSSEYEDLSKDYTLIERDGIAWQS